MAINNFKQEIDKMVNESKAEPTAQQPKQIAHNVAYRNALNEKYGGPIDKDAVRDAYEIWKNNQNDDDWYPRNMKFLADQYNKRSIKPDFDPVRFGKIIENQIDSRLVGQPNPFNEYFNKRVLTPTDRKYLASGIYEDLLDSIYIKR